MSVIVLAGAEIITSGISPYIRSYRALALFIPFSFSDCRYNICRRIAMSTQLVINITGASTGFGALTARCLAKRNHIVFAGRNQASFAI